MVIFIYGIPHVYCSSIDAFGTIGNCIGSWSMELEAAHGSGSMSMFKKIHFTSKAYGKYFF